MAMERRPKPQYFYLSIAPLSLKCLSPRLVSCSAHASCALDFVKKMKSLHSRGWKHLPTLHEVRTAAHNKAMQMRLRRTADRQDVRYMR